MPERLSGKVRTSRPSAASNGRTVEAYFDQYGRLAAFLDALISGEDQANDRLRVETKPADADLTALETLQNAAVATGNGSTTNLKGYKSATLLCTLAGTATITFEGTLDDSTYFTVGLINAATGAVASTATATSAFYFPQGLVLSTFRARISAWTSGATTAVIRKHPR